MIKFNPPRKTLKILKIIVFAHLIILAFFSLRTIALKKFVYPIKYQTEITEYSSSYNLNRALVYSVVKVESDFSESAVSSKGAKGLMQITDATAKYIATLLNENKYNLFDAKTNIRYGCFYLNYLISRFSDTETAIVAYNAGEGRVAEWLKNPKYSNDGITLKNIPFKESKEYLEKITQTFSKYKKLYKNILDK